MSEVSRDYQSLVSRISSAYEEARTQAARQVAHGAVQAYWAIGQHIVEFEQAGEARADYGAGLMDRLAKDLGRQHGRGFSRSNLKNMRALYLAFPNRQTLSGDLGWSIYCELIKIEGEQERGFYEAQCRNEGWSVRELKRQKASGLFERLALSSDTEGVTRLAQEGQVVTAPSDLIRDPYVLEFLGLPELGHYDEQELEARLIHKLQDFLLELGKGFAFVGSQYRMTLANRHYYADLVFYHCILKCYVIIDLKVGEVQHEHIGQMNLYLNYFSTEVNADDDNPPIGLILAKEKDDILVEYATGGLTNQLFVSRYLLHLPDKKLLAERLRDMLEDEA